MEGLRRMDDLPRRSWDDGSTAAETQFSRTHFGFDRFIPGAFGPWLRNVMSIRMQFCEQRGAALTEGMRFCESCGVLIGMGAKVPKAMAATDSALERGEFPFQGRPFTQYPAPGFHPTEEGGAEDVSL